MSYKETIKKLEEEIYSRQQAIEALKRLNGGGMVPIEAKVERRGGYRKTRGSMNINDGITRFLSANPQVFNPSQIYKGIKELGVNCKRSSVNPQLSKLKQMGKVKLVGDGLYSYLNGTAA